MRTQLLQSPLRREQKRCGEDDQRNDCKFVARAMVDGCRDDGLSRQQWEGKEAELSGNVTPW